MISIVAVENNRIAKYAQFYNLEDAEAHCKAYGGFVYDGDYSPDLWVENEKVSVKPIPPIIPNIVGMAQARLALLNAGLLDLVDESIDIIPNEMQKKSAKIDWEFRTTVNRDSHLVNGLAGALGLTEEMLDDLFLNASKL